MDSPSIYVRQLKIASPDHGSPLGIVLAAGVENRALLMLGLWFHLWIKLANRVLNYTLFAQLAADYLYNRKTQSKDWYKNMISCSVGSPELPV